MAVSLRQLHHEIGRQLALADIDEPRREAAILLSHFLSLPLSAIYAKPELPVEDSLAQRIHLAAARRARHEPLAYVLGETEFSGLKFIVGPGVLTPRADSELLVETGLSIGLQLDKKYSGSRPLQILDTCTGSGCLGISLSVLLLQRGVLTNLWLVDADSAALAYARKNVALHHLTENVKLEQSDLYPSDCALKWDLIMANPPYIAKSVIPGLMPEVRCHEPWQALDGGPDGLSYYRRLIGSAPGHLVPGGWLLVEHGYDQAQAVGQLFQSDGRFEQIPVVHDYGGQPRVSGACLKTDQPATDDNMLAKSDF